ncbi:MAG: alpha/beta hydrolase [Lachnospiraceae bacterium]|nr:alpha/beta hydrolase [Lachnospiraceae bacterium]
MTEGYFKYHNLNIRYREAGEGPLLVMLHGWGANADLFAGVEQFAAQKYRVVSPDLPGFGKSEEPAEAYDLDDYVDFAAAFVRHVLDAEGALTEESTSEQPPDTAPSDALGTPEESRGAMRTRTVPAGQNGRRVVLLGHSHGGRVILRLLARMAGDEAAGVAPEDFGFTVPKAILTDSAGIVPERTEEQKKRTQRYKTYKNLLTKTGIAKIAPGSIDALQKKFGSADYAAASPVMRQSMVKVVNTDLQAEMPRIKIPVLLIWGDKDTATPLSDGKRMEALMPEAGLAVIAGAGHYSFLENPVLYNRILGSFLEI